MNFYQELKDYIEKEKMSSTEIADAMGKTGAIPHLHPVSEADFVIGKMRCLFTANNSNYYLHTQLDLIEEDEVVVVFTEGCENKAIFGDIVCKYMLEVKKAKAVVVQGFMRDIDVIKERNYALWCQGYTPIGCFNRETSPYPYEKKNIKMQKYAGSLVVCDATGVVSIPECYFNQSMLNRLKGLRLQEEVWNYCISDLGWNTDRTICKKDYLNHMDKLPKRFQDNEELLRIKFGAEPERNDQMNSHKVAS